MPSHVWSRCRVALLLGISMLMFGGRAPVARAETVYATFRITGGSPLSVFGTFDLASPTGSPGSYSYAWTPLLTSTTAIFTNVAQNPITGELVLNYDNSQFRSISTTGVISGSLGPIPTLWGMAFDMSGNLYGYSPYTSPNTWLKLDPATGQTMTAGKLTGQATSPYSSYSGNMTTRPAGGLFLGGEYDAQLVQVTPTGVDGATVITGTMSGGGFNPTNFGMSLFASGTSLYMLADASLYQVNQSTAALTLLGAITGLPAGFQDFTGATSLVTAAVPEPATITLAGLGLGLLVLSRRFRRRSTRHEKQHA